MPQPKKYEGTYRGTVISKQDPKKQMRVQVRVAEIFSGIPDKYLPWATYQLPLGSRPGNGGIIPVQVGDIVWVRFDAGDSRQPIIVAAASSMPGGKPNLPDDVWQGPDSYQHKRAEGEPAPDTPGYAEDVVFKQHNGLIQLTHGGSIRVTQLSSGTAIEIPPDGTILLHGENAITMSAPTRIKMTCGASSLEITPGNIKAQSPRIDFN